jgi:GT2 family glycosyltransferase/glycosyltransferase involved in cell wall biosynthesis
MPDPSRPQPHSHSDWLLGGAKAHLRPEAIDLAIDAWGRGQAAFEAGDLAAARYWAERAARLGPQDTQVRFLLGIVLLRQRESGALAIFQSLVTVSDTVPAHRGLVAAAALCGDRAVMARAAADLLARFSPPGDTEFPGLAAHATAAASLPGWCGVDAAGRVTISTAERGTCALDGRVIAPRRRADGQWNLPRTWVTAERLTVTMGGRHLLGSPIDLQRRRRIEGFVEGAGGGLRGWAWCPADPEAKVQLTVTAANGRLPAITVETAEVARFPNQDGLTAPRAFHLPPEGLRHHSGPLHVRDGDGRELIGSPLDPDLWRHAATAAARLAGAPAAGGAKGRASQRPTSPLPTVMPTVIPIWADTPPPERRTAPRPGRLMPAVIVPVYRGVETTLACLARVLETVPDRTPVIVVDDAGPEPELSAALDRLARAHRSPPGRIRLIRNPHNLGFPASANIGMAAAGPGRDVVLLNSDAIVPPGWLERLRDAAWSAPDIGTAAPLSNDATILSYPHLGRVQPPPDTKMLDRIDRLAARANGGRTVEIPTSVGFCMYIRGDCLAETGLFRPEIFAQGYGEENDFCLRARHLGWRHVAASGVFVSHIGGQSFRATREHLLRRNLQLLERLHPGYHELIAAHVAADPLADARRRLDLTRWRALRPPPAKIGAVILITHDEGGGVERQIGVRARALAEQGFRPITLRPGADGSCLVAPGEGPGDVWRGDFPNLRFAVPGELPELAALLRRERPTHVELHHQLGHNHALLTLPGLLGVPMDVFVHDYAAICPRVTLVTTSNRYCGEPDAAQCEACVADLGSRLREEISVAALRRRTAADLSAARQVVFPSPDSEKRLRRYVPGLRGAVTPWEVDAASPGPGASANGEGNGTRRRGSANGRRRVAIIGAIGTEKGYDVILDCARDAARRDLPLEFVIIGYTHDDLRLIDTGRAEITYRFAPDRAVAEITAQGADIAFIPSIWPETWCFALSDAWAAGLKAAVFDIGTQAERVRATNKGWVLPLALPPLAINNTLIALAETQF